MESLRIIYILDSAGSAHSAVGYLVAWTLVRALSEKVPCVEGDFVGESEW